MGFDDANQNIATMTACLQTILTYASDAVRRSAADDYLRLRRVAVHTRFSTYINNYRCSRGRCIERCLELIDMPQVQYAALDSGLKYNEVTIDVHRDIVTGVFYTEYDLGRDQNDLLPGALAATPVDRADPATWRQRKLVIARQLADLLDASRGGAPIVQLYMLTNAGTLQVAARA